ncbi:uncharacterized protein LOC113505223 isoform X2 [Trichoplusia ni]|uniref:Uncharacterized protein LOC113505223 isoform X2 n=1 Tax=Trichoplusia ni TaxID=7111 RepID=A0A7E5WTZ0_TRINI|nr:uncharacterized protein LOC113505223 isoform X2 [Trichoplusia ni]
MYDAQSVPHFRRPLKIRAVAHCQKLWKNLRDCYKKALILRRNKIGSRRKTKKPIKFEQELEFLKPHLEDRSQALNLCPERSLDEDNSIIESQTSDVGESSHSDSGFSNQTTRNETLALLEKLFRQYVEAKEKEEDPLDTFFLLMSKSVKNMPIRSQARLKHAIFTMVTATEVKLASEKSSNNRYGIQQQQSSLTSTPSNIPPTTYCLPSASTKPPENDSFIHTLIEKYLSN